MAPDIEKYPPSVRELITPERIAPLDAGMPNPAARPLLKALDRADITAGRKPADPLMADACLAGLWLYHDFITESHELSQEIHTKTGSFWHAIMHRREQDYGNAKYWLGQTGTHEAFGAILDAAREEFSRRPARPGDSTRAFAPLEVQALVAAPKWDPYRFVDLCEAATAGDRELKRACLTLQSIEWRVLFDYCFERAATN